MHREQQVDAQVLGEAIRIFTLTNRKHIVVLDDDMSMLDSVKRVLKAHGFDAKVFDSVEGFLGGARLGDAVCLVMDVDLNGTSGIDVARQLARSGHSLPVIFMTGNQSETIRQAALEAGCIAYLHKPFSSNQLIAAIEQIVGRNIAAR